MSSRSDAEPRRDSSEWAETAARLSRRVQELELENFRLKNGKEPPNSFAGGEMRALRVAESEVAATTGGMQRRASLNKSRSCANGFGVTGLTVAEAAAASHRTRTRRLASAASATEAAVKLRSGYWNGTNNVKSSFSCNNLADLEQPEFVLEKLRTLPSPAVAVSINNGGNKNGTTAPTVSATTVANEASRKSDSFQRTSSETKEDIADMRSQNFGLKKMRKSLSIVAQPSSSSAGLSLDESFDEGENRITSPRSYFEAGLRTGSFSLGPTVSPALKSGKRASVRDVRMWVGTWNMGAADPFDDGKGIIDEQRSATMLQNFLPHGYQLYILGVQEGVSENVYHAVEAYLNRNEQGTRYYRMELKNSNFMVNHKNQPPDAVIDAVHGRGDGAFVGTKFTGMAVFYCADIQDKLKLIRAGAHKFKLTSGSKGGVAVALMINHTTMVFVNCHLDARNDTYRREQIRNLNASLGRVMGHYSFDLTEQFHHVVWMGDMNYRIVLLDPQMVLHMLEEGRNLELHDKFDGLLNDRRNGGVFEGFTEPHKFPNFYPTYKKFPKRGVVNESLPLWPSLVWRVLYKEPFYKGGKVKKRVPGWCDRILIHSLLVSDSKLIPEKVPDPFSQEDPRLIDNYQSVNHGDGMDVSDHSPVFGTFVLSFPQHDSETLASGSPRRLTRRNSRSFSTASGISDGDRYSHSVSGSYFDQARVVRQMKAQNRPVSTVLRVFNMELSWNDNVVVPKKTRIVAPLVGEDAKQCDVIGERCQGSNGLNLSLNAVIQHTRPLEQLHMLVWVKNESINGHCTLSLKRIARQEEGGEVKFRCEELTAMPTPPLDSVRATEQHADAPPDQSVKMPVGPFKHLPDAIPVLRDFELRQKLLQWNLSDTLQLKRFRVHRRLPSEADEALLAEFFQDDSVHRVLQLPARLGNTSPSSLKELARKPESGGGASLLHFQRLRASVTSMAFFEKLQAAGIIARDGSVRGCIDEDFDGCTAGDLLTEMLVNPDSDNCDVFSETDQKEFIFHLFSALVIGGGALRQAHSRVQAYESATRALYRALLSVKKSIAGANGKRDIEITSRVVDCYRSHGEDCTEHFFESHVRSEMQLASNTRGDDAKQQQKSIQELFERVREFQEEQQREDDEELLAKRMQELAMMDAAGELTLEKLTPEERKKFFGEVADGRLGKLVELWSPWWLMAERKYRSETSARRRQLIMEEISGSDDAEDEKEVGAVDIVKVEPTVLYPVGLFTSSDAQKMPTTMGALLPSGRQPSPYLRFHLVEVVFAYALVIRVFNGDYAQDVAEAALMLLDLCQVLSADARYESVEHVCLACMEKQSSEGSAANALAIRDAQQLLRTKVFLLDALSDTRALLERYQEDLQPSSESDKHAKKERKAAQKSLAAVQKKLQFYLTWAFLAPIEEFQALSGEVEDYMNNKELLG
ncbi:unnamed protein product [Phytophthora lilii]|uniref:Unnamed protein product n=1 Tax=Phytophthora lilii TaxID=2077276 RepID=A0A9W6TFA3_9STRA|nr:unnamed protein product [Phytophthora lilii]